MEHTASTMANHDKISKKLVYCMEFSMNANTSQALTLFALLENSKHEGL